ncbi:hypothetical protein ACO1KT_14420, partial [Staphylococcus aureus]
VIHEIRERVARELPEVRVEFVQVLQDVLNDLSGTPRPVEVKTFGPDYARLHEIADAIADKLEHVEGAVDLYRGRERETPDLRFVLKNDELARLGAT